MAVEKLYFWPAVHAQIVNTFNYYYVSAVGISLLIFIYCCTSSPDHKLTLYYIGVRVALFSSQHYFFFFYYY